MRRHILSLVLTSTLAASPALAGMGGAMSSLQLKDLFYQRRSKRLLEGLEQKQREVEEAPENRKNAPRKAPKTKGRRDFRSQRSPTRRPATKPVPMRPAPPRPPPEVEVFSLDAKGDAVAVKANDMKRLGPAAKPERPKPPGPPLDYSPGTARLEVDLVRGRGDLKWTFRALKADPKPLHVALPPALRHLELDDAPVPLAPDDRIAISGAGEHTLHVVFPLELEGNRRWGRARVWVPSEPSLEIHATLPADRLVATVEGGRNLRHVAEDGRVEVHAVRSAGGPVQLRWEEKGAELTMAAAPSGPIEADISAESVCVYRLRGPDLRVDAALRFQVGPPGVNGLRIHVEPGLDVLEVRDGNGQPWPRMAVLPSEEEPGQVILLSLPARQSGTLMAKVHLAARPEPLAALASQQAARLKLPRVYPLDAGRAPEFLAIAKDPRTRVGVQGGLQPKDRTELPGWCPQTTRGVDGPIGRRVPKAPPVVLSVEPLRSIPNELFRIDGVEANSLLSPRDGSAMHRVTYQVRNTSNQFLQLELPEDARLLGATVRGEPVKPGVLQEGSRQVVLALPTADSRRQAVPPAIPVQVVYATPLPALGGRGRLELALPRPEAPVEASTWSVHYPSSYRVEHRDGAFKEITRSFGGLSKKLSGRLGALGTSSSAEFNEFDDARQSLVSQIAVPMSNVVMPSVIEDPEEERVDTGLLPVEVRLPLTGSMWAIHLEQGAVSRGSRSWNVELGYTHHALQSRASETGSTLMVLGVFLLLLWLSGYATRTPGAVSLLAGAALLAAMLGLDTAATTQTTLALIQGIALAFVWALATPLRRVHRGAALALLAAFGSLQAAPPRRIEAVLPTDEKGPKRLVTSGSDRVLVPEADLEALREAAEARRKKRARLTLRLPFQVQGKGPFEVQAVRGDLAVVAARLAKGRDAARPVSLRVREDHGLRTLEKSALGTYAGYLAGRDSVRSQTAAVGYEVVVTEASPDAPTAYTLELEVVIPVKERSDGGYDLELEPPPASARRLKLALPGQVRVEVRGDPFPSGAGAQDPIREGIEEPTRIDAYPSRSGSVRVSWYPRSSHARRRRRRAPAPAPAPEDSSPAPAPAPRAATPDAPPAKEAERLLLADWEVQAEVAEEQVRGVAEARIEVLRGSVDILTLAFPPEVKVVDVEGPRVAEHRPLSEKTASGLAQVAVRFQARRQGQFKLRIPFRIPLPASGGEARRDFRVPMPELLEAADQRHRVGLRVEGSQEVRAREVTDLEPTATGPEEVLAFVSQGGSPQLSVGVESFPSARVFAATISRMKATTHMRSGETRKVELEFTVENNGQDFLTFRLPEGTLQESLQLAKVERGQPRPMPRVLDRDDNLQISLPTPPAGQRDPAQATYRLSYDRKAPQPEGLQGREVLRLPVPDLPISEQGLTWEVRLAKDYQLAELHSPGKQRPARPFARSGTAQLSGYVHRADDEDPAALRLEVVFYKKGLTLTLCLLLLLGLTVACAGVPYLVLGRVDLGVAPRAGLVLLVLVAGSLAREAELPIPGWAFELSGAVGGAAALALVLRSRLAAAALILAVAGVQAAEPPGVDLRYLGAKEAAGRAARSGYRAVPLSEVRRLLGEVHRPEPEKPRPPEAGSPLVRQAEHAVRVDGESVSVRSTYLVEGPGEGAWSLELDLGPEAAIRSLRARRGGQALSGASLVPAHGPGSPTRGAPAPGRYEVRGLKGRAPVELEVSLVLPAIRDGGGGSFRITGLASPVSRFTLDLPGAVGALEVFPGVDVSSEEKGERTHAKGWLRPASSFAVRWRPRTRPKGQTPRPEVDVPVRFDATVNPTYQLRGRRLLGNHDVTLAITQGGLESVRLQLVEGEELLGVTGSGVSRVLPRDPVDGRRPVDVLLDARRSGNLRLKVRTLTLLEAEVAHEERLRREVPLPGLEVVAAQRTQGQLRLDPAPGSSLAKLDAEGATRIDPREARPRAPQGSLVLRFLTPEYQVRATLERFPPRQPQELRGRTGTLKVVPLDAQSAAYVARYQLATRGHQSLRVGLPEKATLVSAQVNGRPVKAGKAGDGRYRVPLAGTARPGEAAEITLELVYLSEIPKDRVSPPALLDTALDTLEVRVAHGRDLRLYTTGSSYRQGHHGPGFFDPVLGAARALPPVVAMLVTAPVTIPLAVLSSPLVLFSGSARSRAPSRLLDQVGNTLDRFEAEPMAPGGGASGKSQRVRRGRRPRAPSPVMEQAAGGPQRQELFQNDKPNDEGWADDDLGDVMEESVGNDAFDVPAEVQAYGQGIGGYGGKDLLGGAGFQGSLPVPLDFHPHDLDVTAFTADYLVAGEAPALELGRTSQRWIDLLLLLGALLAAGGTIQLVRQGIRSGSGWGLLLVGLGAGLWLRFLHGRGGSDVWQGVVLGLALGLVIRTWTAWRSRSDERGGEGRGE
jgi:hypothetical protein